MRSFLCVKCFLLKFKAINNDFLCLLLLLHSFIHLTSSPAPIVFLLLALCLKLLVYFKGNWFNHHKLSQSFDFVAVIVVVGVALFCFHFFNCFDSSQNSSQSFVVCVCLCVFNQVLIMLMWTKLTNATIKQHCSQCCQL